MKPIKSMTNVWFHRRGSSIRDLYALGVLAIAERGQRRFVVPGIIGVLLLASLREANWFKQRAPVRTPHPRSGGCASPPCGR